VSAILNRPLPTVIDWESLGSFNPRRITRFRHNLDAHPLLQTEALRVLAKRVDGAGLVKFKPATAGSPHDPFMTAESHDKGWTLDQVFDRLSEPGVWLAIYEMNTDSSYRAFCDQLMREITAHIKREDPGMYGADLAVFLSAPPAFTPYHIDQHPVFFFQARGTKRLNLWDSFDPEVLPPEVAEEFLCSKTEGKVKYRDTIQPKVVEIELGPGDGVYWPATTPHLTYTEAQSPTSGDGYSLSFNISYYTEATRRRVCVSAFNELLRKHAHAHPRPYGSSAAVDSVKAPLGRAFLGLRRLLKGQYLRPEQGL
jgi:hypothetical protein